MVVVAVVVAASYPAGHELAGVPVLFAADAVGDVAQRARLLRIPRLLRLFRLAKLLKIVRASRIFKRWERKLIVKIRCA